MAQADPYGLLASGLPPEIAAQARGLTREQAIAEALLAQSQKPLETNRMAGGYVIPISPFEGLAKVAQAYFGQRKLSDVDKRYADLGTKFQTGQAEAIQNYLKSKYGSPETTIPSATPNDDEGNPMPSAVAPSVKADPRAAAVNAMVSNYPMVKALATKDYEHQLKFDDPYTLRPGESRYGPNNTPIATAPIKPSPFTMGPGQKRYDEAGAVVASAPEKPIVDHNFSVGENMVQTHISHDGGTTWAPLPGSKPSAKFSRQVVNVNAQPQQEPPPVAIVGPDGKPVLVGRRDAIGKTPYSFDPTSVAAVADAKAGGKVTGTNTATARVNLPQVEAQTEQGLKLVDDLVKHPGKSYAVGAGGAAQTWRVPGTPGADFKARLDQIKGQQFLSAYNTLKGGGQITEVEGKKATDAIARMQQSTSIKEFDTAAGEYQEVLRKGLERARASAQNRRATDAPGGADTNDPLGIRR